MRKVRGGVGIYENLVLKSVLIKGKIGTPPDPPETSPLTPVAASPFLTCFLSPDQCLSEVHITKARVATVVRHAGCQGNEIGGVF